MQILDNEPATIFKWVTVVNTSKKHIPSKSGLAKREQGMLLLLERRKHLRQPKIVRDKQGNVQETLLPLDDQETQVLEELAQKKRDQLEPCIAHNIFAFEPWGKQGCAWIMPEGWANLVVAINPQRLSILPAGETLPEGVKAQHHGAPPSAFEGTFHHPDAEALRASPGHDAAFLEGHAVRDGVTVEQGSMLRPVGK